ncbi:MAG: hypothetical protein ACE5HE_08250 [Phycisphaerae bacterium]
MKTLPIRSLSGKARRARRANRTARLHADQLIMDYFNSNSDSAEQPGERGTPVKFANDVQHSTGSSSPHAPPCERFELFPRAPSGTEDEAVCRVPPPSKAAGLTVHMAEPTADRHAGKTRRPLTQTHNQNPASQFTVRGFACGCAIGAAAAAVVLLCLQAVL